MKKEFYLDWRIDKKIIPEDKNIARKKKLIKKLEKMLKEDEAKNKKSKR